MIEIPEGQMTTTQAAQFLGVSIKRVQNMVRGGQLERAGSLTGGAGRPAILLSILDVKRIQASREDGTKTAKRQKTTAARPVSKPRTAAPDARDEKLRRLQLIVSCEAEGIFTVAEALERVRAELERR